MLKGTGCEMYTETLSPSFIGMSFAQAAETCFVKVTSRKKEQLTILVRYLHCKKNYRFSRPQMGYYLPNSPWPVIIKLFLASESLLSDIPAGDGKIVSLFYSLFSEM
jgi:hypothetical protein